jgi:hypothetical protein
MGHIGSLKRGIDKIPTCSRPVIPMPNLNLGLILDIEIITKKRSLKSFAALPAFKVWLSL